MSRRDGCSQPLHVVLICIHPFPSGRNFSLQWLRKRAAVSRKPWDGIKWQLGVELQGCLQSLNRQYPFPCINYNGLWMLINRPLLLLQHMVVLLSWHLLFPPSKQNKGNNSPLTLPWHMLFPRKDWSNQISPACAELFSLSLGREASEKILNVVILDLTGQGMCLTKSKWLTPLRLLTSVGTLVFGFMRNMLCCVCITEARINTDNKHSSFAVGTKRRLNFLYPETG